MTDSNVGYLKLQGLKADSIFWEKLGLKGVVV